MTPTREQQQASMEAAGLTPPKATITLKVAEEGDRTMVVAEEPSQILARIEDARVGRSFTTIRPPMILLTRLLGFKPSEFWTRFDNIANVEPYR